MSQSSPPYLSLTAVSGFVYDGGSSDALTNLAMRSLISCGGLLAIDPAVGAHNGLWETFFDDVAMVG